MIVAAVDGSSLSNPGPAGWAWYIDDDNWEAGGWPSGTNNMGELQAVLSLLRATRPVAAEPLKVLCDSQYVINSVTKWMPGWKRRGWRKADGKPVLNQDLLKALDAELRDRNVSFEWVRGHAGHAMNEAADARARAVATAYQNGTAIDRGPGFQLAGAGRPPQADDPIGASNSAAAPDGSRVGPAAHESRPDDLQPPFDLTPHQSGAQAASSAAGRNLAHSDLARADPAAAPEGIDTDVLRVVEQEKELLTDRVRSDPAQVRALLHPQFTEFGSSGRIWTRNRLLAEIQPMPMRVHYEPIGADRLADDIILLRWRAVSGHAEWLRSSVWQRSADGWRLRFAQGTPAAK